MPNTTPYCITAAAGTVLARGFFSHLFFFCILAIKKNEIKVGLQSANKIVKKRRVTTFAFSFWNWAYSQLPFAEQLHLAFTNCKRLFTAAGGAGRPFSVLLWPFSCLGRLWILGLVSCKITNHLIQTKKNAIQKKDEMALKTHYGFSKFF